MGIRSLKSSSISTGAKRSKFWDQSAALYSYYLVSFGTAGGTEAATTIRKDSSGNWYTAGVEGGSTVSGVRKFNSTLSSITWQKTAGLGTYTGYDGLELDASNNPIVAGYNNQSGRVSGRAKFSAADGSTTWHYYYGVSGYANGLTQDSSGNLYSAPGGAGGIGMLKTASDGTSPVFYYRSGSTYATGVTFNPSTGFLYLLSTGAGSTYAGEISCLSTTGSLQWSKSFTSTYSTNPSQSLSFDSSNNIYLAAYAADSGTSGGYCAAVKFDSSGNILWSRKLDAGTGSLDQWNASAIDSSGNIYFAGVTGSSGLIAKYNSSGTIQWQRTMSGCNFTDIMVDSNLELVVSGNVGNDGIIVRVPTDGTKTGTYTLNGVSLTYAASSLTDSAAGWSASNTGYSFTSTTPSITSVSTSYSTDSSTLSKVTI